MLSGMAISLHHMCLTQDSRAKWVLAGRELNISTKEEKNYLLNSLLPCLHFLHLLWKITPWVLFPPTACCIHGGWRKASCAPEYLPSHPTKASERYSGLLPGNPCGPDFWNTRNVSQMLWSRCGAFFPNAITRDSLNYPMEAGILCFGAFWASSAAQEMPKTLSGLTVFVTSAWRLLRVQHPSPHVVFCYWFLPLAARGLIKHRFSGRCSAKSLRYVCVSLLH